MRRSSVREGTLTRCTFPYAAASAGQRVCRVGRERPCYKLAYFSDPRRRLNFAEAEQACRRDGGELLGVETASEQRVIEQLISEIKPTDGDFWIGLRRQHGDQESILDCSSQYYWVDGSQATYRQVLPSSRDSDDDGGGDDDDDDDDKEDDDDDDVVMTW